MERVVEPFSVLFASYVIREKDGTMAAHVNFSRAISLPPYSSSVGRPITWGYIIVIAAIHRISALAMSRGPGTPGEVRAREHAPEYHYYHREFQYSTRIFHICEINASRLTGPRCASHCHGSMLGSACVPRCGKCAALAKAVQEYGTKPA